MSDVKRATYKSSGPDSGDYVRAERHDEIRALLVKACVEIAMDEVALAKSWPDYAIGYIREKYGVLLKWNQIAATFEEDTTK